MRLMAIALMAAAVLPAQVLTFSIDGPQNSLTPLPASYQFPDTSQGSSSSIVLQATNNSNQTVLLIQAYVGSQAGSAELSPNFTITGLFIDKILAPGASSPFTLNFTPGSPGPITGFLQAAYSVQQDGCTLQNATPAEACPSSIVPVSTLQGNGTAAQLVLSYDPGSGLKDIQPNASSRLEFGGISVSTSKSVVFTISNRSAAAIPTPAVSLRTGVFVSSAFSLDISSLPASIAAGSSSTFTVTFAPGQTGLETTILVVGSNLYPLAGTGIVVAEDDALRIWYVDSTGVRGLPQAATPISFGQLTAGTGATATLNFTVTNPMISFGPVMVSSIRLTGSAFSVSGLPALPASIAPGSSITFALTYSAASGGTSTGSLAIGTRVFSLNGQSISLPLPSVSLQVSPTPLTSQQQATLTVQLASASLITAIGELELTFAPSVTNVSDDPAIAFVATNSRQLQVNVAAGAKTATYNGQSGLAFQTGTTAGTITFTLTFPDLAPITQSFSITPGTIVFTSAKASWQEPNLVVTVDGYDNTYSAGRLLFMFYDPNGNAILPNGMQVDASSQFKQYFLNSNQAGGAFALQATFPVSGEDVSHIGSVSLTMSNSAGKTSTNRLSQ